MEGWIVMARENARSVLVVLLMTVSVALAQENIGWIPPGEERSSDYAVQVGGPGEYRLDSAR